jgi:hypothetical protein
MITCWTIFEAVNLSKKELPHEILVVFRVSGKRFAVVVAGRLWNQSAIDDVQAELAGEGGQGGTGKVFVIVARCLKMGVPAVRFLSNAVPILKQ